MISLQLTVCELPIGNVLSYICTSPDGQRHIFFTMLDASLPLPTVSVATDCPLTVSILPPQAGAENFTQFTLSVSPGKQLAGLSLAEQLRRERARDMGSGLAACEWATQLNKGVARMLVPLSGCLYIFDYCTHTGEGSVVRVYGEEREGEGAIDPHLSPDGLSLCFVLERGSDKDIYLLSLADRYPPFSSNAPPPSPSLQRLTQGGEGVASGVAEY
ncbi:hypothetical protein EON64_17880, partial [archaeon]